MLPTDLDEVTRWGRPGLRPRHHPMEHSTVGRTLFIWGGYPTYFFECIRPSFGCTVNHPLNEDNADQHATITRWGRAPTTGLLDIQSKLCSLNSARRRAPPSDSRSRTKSRQTRPGLACENDRPTVWTPARWNVLYTAVPRTPDAPGWDVGPSDHRRGEGGWNL